MKRKIAVFAALLALMLVVCPRGEAQTSKGGRISEGTLAARPACPSVAQIGDIYNATDQVPTVITKCDSTGWSSIGASTPPAGSTNDTQINGGGGNFGAVANGKTGQIYTSTNSAAPGFQSPGLGDGNGGAAVTTTPYTIQCDSGTALIDRAHLLRFQTGASVVTVPSSVASGCTGNFAVTVADDGAGTLTFNRSSSDTFSVFDGVGQADGQTSFTLKNGQHATLSQGATGIWEVRTTPPPSGNSHVMATAIGTLVSNDCVNIDANGNFKDAQRICGTDPTVSSWISGGNIVIPFVSTDQENMEESNWLYEGNCQILTTLSTCWKVWHSVGWATTGMSYAECPSLKNGAPGQCTRLLNGAPLTTIGTGTSGGRSRAFVLHQGATYYMFVCGATCTTMDLWSSSTGKDDWVLVQAAILTTGTAGAWDDTIIFNATAWVEGTTFKLVYTGLHVSGGNGVYGMGYAQCTSACTGGAATFAKDVGNPIITGDGVNPGGYGNADFHIINGVYWLWGHSSGTTANLLPSDIYTWQCGPAGVGNKPTGCVQTPSGVPSLGRQSTDEGASTTVGQVADANLVERTDINKTFLFYEGDMDGTQQGGLEHLKYVVAEMPLATLVTTNQVRSPVLDSTSLNSLAVGIPHTPVLGAVSVGNASSVVGFKANNPTCNFQYVAANANTDHGGLFCNLFANLDSGASLSARMNTSLTAMRFQANISNANSTAGIFLGHTNTSGTETFPLQGLFDGNGLSFDILPGIRAGGTTPTLTGTGACATITTQVGAWTGSFKCTGTTGAATVTMTFASGIATNGWNCVVQDETTRANLLQQTSHTATTCVLTATSVTQNDIFVFQATGF